MLLWMAGSNPAMTIERDFDFFTRSKADGKGGQGLDGREFGPLASPGIQDDKMVRQNILRSRLGRKMCGKVVADTAYGRYEALPRVTLPNLSG